MFVLSEHLDFDQIMVEPLVTIATDRGERAGLGIRLYQSCPHVEVPLDYGDGRCLADPECLLCLHGARFASESAFVPRALCG